MQFLWKYIDEILGKGYTVLDIGEMIIYFMITQIPMALPISILLSSVMVYGSLAERYEISSMKSAGVSLLRIMKPGIMLAIFTAILSLLASNIFKPQANFQFQKRIKSIRAQKSALVIEEKIFNKDFKDFSIRVNKRLDDNKSIEDILIYDHSQVDKSLLNLTKADKGKMYTEEGTGNFVMELYDGTQYSELKREYLKDNRRSYPLMRTKFKKWQKVFDTEEFSTDGFSVNINRNKEDMLNAYQLVKATDSIGIERESLTKEFKEVIRDRKSPDARGSIHPERQSIVKNKGELILMKVDDPQSIIDYMKNEPMVLSKILLDAKRTSSGIRDRLRITASKLEANNYKKRKYLLRLNQQFSFACICIVFMFLGAPLGSIIRKGGFGYPLLYAIGFYMMFIMLAIMGEKLVRSGSMGPVVAAWISNIILIPLAAYLTYQALKDAKSTIFSRARDTVFNLFKKGE